MKIQNLLLLLFLISLPSITPKSQDYARHIELSFLFFECQRSGKLPEDHRIYWRHDSMTDAGKDVGLDLTGGYYDAGDNVKYNFPGAASMTLIAWSGIQFAEAYKKAGQWEYLLKTVKWGMDYFIKCHPEKNVLYVGVGDGHVDHAKWYPPEYIDYDYPSFKVDASNPGSEVAGETAAAMTAASLLFKSEDSAYSATLLQHAKELYDFADTYRGDYTQSVPSVSGFYSSYSGYEDELAWGAAWLYYATGDESYYEKYKVISDKEVSEWDQHKFQGAEEPISWDDKRPGCYVLIAMATKEESRMDLCYHYCDVIISQPKTPGGLYYHSQLSMWASNRYAANAAAMVAMFASILPESDSKRKGYIDFVKSQIDYILGDNPAGVNFVVGAEENSPKSVHRRGASGTYDSQDMAKPAFNIFTLYGALAGGPGSDDSYKDSRSNYQMNEVALDYNAGFTLCLASLIHFGYGTKDSGEILNFDRAWPQKAPTPDVSVTMDESHIFVSTGSGLMCASWCVHFTYDFTINAIYDSTPLSKDPPDYIVCNVRDTGFLDGEGTQQHATMQINDKENYKAPTEFKVLCNGYNAHEGSSKPAYIPEFGQMYKVTSPGGPSNTEPLFETSKCWPSFIC